MQASKIKLGGEYAIRYDGELHALRVIAINSVRNHKGTSNSVSGYVLNDDGSSMESEDGIIQTTFAVSDLLGEFSEYSDMVAARQARHAEKQAAEKARDDASLDLVRQFYRMAGVPMPNKLDYNSMFNLSYGGKIEIQQEGVALLLEALKVRA